MGQVIKPVMYEPLLGYQTDKGFLSAKPLYRTETTPCNCTSVCIERFRY